MRFSPRRLLATATTLVTLCLTTGGCAGPEASVPTSADGVRPLLPGMAAPEFRARRADGGEHHFDPDQLEKPTVISFYRGGWCPYCNSQLADMRRAEKQLTGMGFELIFLSADRAGKLEPSLEQKGLGYMLLSDNSMAIARAFGVAFTVDKETVDRYLGKGIDLEEASGMDHHQLPVPSTFLIGTDGLVHFQYANPNYKKRLDPELLIAAAKLHMVAMYVPGSP